MLSPEESKLFPARYDPKTGDPTPIRQMRPREVESAEKELASVEKLLDPSRAFVNRNVDVPEARRYANALKRKLEEEAPQALGPGERDVAVALEERLRGDWLQGMPTQEEMRRNPAGAVDKHMSWERAKKKSILAWKNLRQRMRSTGMLNGDIDASNIEMYRPSGGAQQLNMHNEQIPAKVMHLPPPGAGPATVFSDDELASLPAELRALVFGMSNEERAGVKRLLDQGLISAEPKKPGRKPMTEERKAALRANLAKGRETAQRNRELRAQQEG